MKNKKVLYGIMAGVLLVGGVGVMAMLNQPKTNTVVANQTTTSSMASKAQETTMVNVAVSELESRLNAEVTAETNVAELEQQLTTVADEKTRETLAKKLAEVKQQHAVKVEEKAKGEQSQPTAVVKSDETSQPVQPTPSTPQPQPAPAPQPTPQPVQTTTRQTTKQTTQATTKKTRISALGNSGKEFATMDEAEDWADGLPSFPDGKHGYWILPVFYSDSSQTYTIDWY